MRKPVKLSKDVVNLLLPRLKNEYEAFYFYNAASNYCKNVGYEIAAEYFAKESKDELEHAKFLEDFLVGWNVIPELPKIDVPQLMFKSLVEVIEKSYEIEFDLYEDYEKTASDILKLGDISVFDMLKKYLEIQTKSVAEYSDMLNILEGCNESSKFELLMLEKKLF